MGIGTPYERTFDEQSGKTTPSSECPECAGELQTEGGETSCTQCGLIVDAYRIDHGPDWLAADEESTPRTGPPRTVTRHDRGLSTEIGHGGDANGTPLGGRKRAQISRLRREHGRARFESKADRNLAHGLAEIARITSAIGLSKSRRERASDLFGTAQSEGLLPGRSIESMAAASVYAACRCNGIPRTLQEIGDVAQVADERVDHAYGILNRELGLPAVPMTPGEYVPRFASELDFSNATRRRAEDLAANALEEGLANGCNPAGLAAACVYVAARNADEQVTQTELAGIADVTPVTIRARRGELRALSDDES